MYYLQEMKKKMFKYLDMMYPDIYLIQLGYGDVVKVFDKEKRGGWFDLSKEIIEELTLMFCVNKATAHIILNEWVENRPKYEYIGKSEDEQVLVPVSK
jgi:hypothetical protein